MSKHTLSISAVGLAFCVLALAVSAASAQTVPAPAPSEKDSLEDMIRAKAQDLERVTKELEATQNNLQSTRSQRASLQKEMNTLQATIRQLELSIQADKISQQKLGYEIDSLSYDIQDIEESMKDKKEAVVKVLRELQATDNRNALMAFLSHSTLAEGVLETQSLANLRRQLDIDVENLTVLQNQLSTKMKTVSDKKATIEFHQKTATAKKSLIEDQKQERTVILTQTKNQESLYEQQVAELKKQQDAIQDEIAKIENDLKAKFNTGVLPTARHGILAWPVKLIADGGKGRVTQHFGEKSSLYRGKPHNGLDIGVPVGTPVYAAEDGTVSASDNNDRSRWSKYQYGQYILIRHPNNLSTLYAHLSQRLVSAGQTVKRGELIGYSGNTGYSTGAHLHFGLYWAPSIQLKSVPPAAGLVPVGVAVAPEDYL